jgi:hypothetical protein
MPQFSPALELYAVLLSIFAPGLSATPGLGLYQRSIALLGPAAPELARENIQPAL